MITNKNILLIIAALLGLAAFPVMAQENTKVWTMNDCMKYAVENCTQVKKDRYSISSAKAEKQAATAAFFPSLMAEADGQYRWGRNIDPKTNTYNNVTTFNSYYGLGTSLTLFDGGQLINQWKKAKISRQQGYNNLQKSKDDKAIETMQAYVDVAYYEGCVRFATDKLEDSHQLLHKTECMKELGIKGKADVAQVKAQVAEDDYNMTRQQNLYNTALLNLKTAMNYPVDDSIKIDTTMYSITPEMNLYSSEDIFNYATTYNPSAKAALLSEKSLRYMYKVNKGALFPSLSISAGINTNYYRDLSAGNQNEPFRSQIKNNRGEYVSATLSIPLFDKLDRISNMRIARNNWRISQIERIEVLRKLRNDIAQSIMDCNGYAKEVTQMQTKVEADSLAFHISYRKYEEGLMDAIDLRTSSNTLLTSRVTLLQKQMLYLLKEKLVKYYKGDKLVNE